MSRKDKIAAAAAHEAALLVRDRLERALGENPLSSHAAHLAREYLEALGLYLANPIVCSDCGVYPPADHTVGCPQDSGLREPCIKCGDHCESQHEHTEDNDGIPWPMCSGCDPACED